MKTLEEIKVSGAVFNLMDAFVMGIQMLCGQIYDRNLQIFFTLGFDEEGWEHAAIHVGNGRKTPSWEVMCKAKQTFWRDDEDVVQLHPKESEYFHGIGMKPGGKEKTRSSAPLAAGQRRLEPAEFDFQAERRRQQRQIETV